MPERIAILLSTFNGEKYIKNQLDSLLDQDCLDKIHIFIRDDGSSDNTLPIIKNYNSSLFTVIKGTNIGSNGSFLELLRIAKTLPSDYEYFSFCDQDDQWDRDKLSIAIDNIKQYEPSTPVLYGSASCHVDSDLKPLEERKKRVIKPLSIYNTIIQNIVPGHTYVFNRALLDIIPDNLDTKRVYYHDAFVLNVANICGALIYDPYPHANYRQHDKNVMGSTNNPIKWLKQRVIRIKNGDSKQYARQIDYLFELYNAEMPEDVCKELYMFLKYRDSIFNRIKYINHSKLFRQSSKQTVLFKLLYIFGGYNT